MIVIREVFIAKPGNGSKLAKLMKEVMGQGKIGKAKIMTDLTGQFNKVVVETELDNVGQIEQRMKEYQNNNELRNKMSGYTDMYMHGRREIYQII